MRPACTDMITRSECRRTRFLAGQAQREVVNPARVLHGTEIRERARPSAGGCGGGQKACARSVPDPRRKLTGAPFAPVRRAALLVSQVKVNGNGNRELTSADDDLTNAQMASSTRQCNTRAQLRRSAHGPRPRQGLRRADAMRATSRWSVRQTGAHGTVGAWHTSSRDARTARRSQLDAAVGEMLEAFAVEVSQVPEASRSSTGPVGAADDLRPPPTVPAATATATGRPMADTRAFGRQTAEGRKRFAARRSYTVGGRYRRSVTSTTFRGGLCETQR